MFIPVRSVAGSGVEPESAGWQIWIQRFSILSPLTKDVNNGVQKYKKIVFLKILLSLIGQLFKEIQPEPGEEP